MTEVINIGSKANIPHVNEITNPPKIVDPKLPINDLSQSGYEEIPVNIPEDNVAHQVTVSKSAHPVLLKEIGNDNPIEILHLAKSAVISQWIDKHVFLSGCEPSIRYVVNIVTHAEEKKKFFNCRELHNWCQKNCNRLNILTLVEMVESLRSKLTEILRSNQKIAVV
jgi:hypothetical protein